MLDADVIVGWETKRFDLVGYLRKRPQEQVVVSSIVWEQLWFGAEHFQPGRAAKRRRHLMDLYPNIKVIEFDTAQARQAACLDAMLRASGQQIGYADTLIAAAAITIGAELFSFNCSEFERTGVVLTSI